jgi:hypothetical protein
MQRNNLLKILEMRYKGKVIIEYPELYQIFIFKTITEAIEKDPTSKVTQYLCKRLAKKLKREMRMNFKVCHGCKSLYVMKKNS